MRFVWAHEKHKFIQSQFIYANERKESCIWNKLIISCPGLIIFGIRIFKFEGFELQLLALTAFEVLLILTGKIHPQIKLKCLRKSMNVDIWVIGTLNQLFVRGSHTQIKFSKK